MKKAEGNSAQNRKKHKNLFTWWKKIFVKRTCIEIIVKFFNYVPINRIRIRPKKSDPQHSNTPLRNQLPRLSLHRRKIHPPCPPPCDSTYPGRVCKFVWQKILVISQHSNTPLGNQLPLLSLHRRKLQNHHPPPPPRQKH